MKLKLVFVIAALAAAPAWAVNKCTGADGKVTFSDTLCPNNTKTQESIKVREGNGNVLQSSGGRGAAQNRVEPNLSLEVTKQAGPLLEYYRRWSDQEKLLGATARIALAQPMSELQKLQREVEVYKPPACLDAAKSALVKLIAANAESMIQFMHKQELTNILYQTRQRPDAINAFEGAMKTARCLD